ncbi:hypothetical protein L0664_05170 [Octadecabacter sp. G9-8]|uniref:Uncharacterized protein n=1 Tax=Octadecabacter dasysiphoniae TaxID=2909341 RepID=A0ABS9CWC7_9RHOB|nr:hypothetical protein [Octadecabacter dasysiphoniae]MCF2870451.1 hypothetical protein [Octadecabacter dasysiphoniae]
MIPIAGIILLAWLIYIVVGTRHINAANVQCDHRPNTPDTGHDKAEIARSSMSGMMGRDR